MLVNKKRCLVFAAVLMLAGCSKAQAPAPSPAVSYATMEPAESVSVIVGTWKLARVEGCMRGEKEKRELNPQENASVYGDERNTYTYKEDGTMVCITEEAGETCEQTGSWIMNEDGSFTVNLNEGVYTYGYERSDDSLRRIYEAPSSADRYTMLEFIYQRAD